MPWRVRPADGEDADAIARVHLESWRRSYRDLLPDSFLASLRHERLVTNWWHRLTTDEVDECVRVIDVGGQVGGFITFGPQHGDASWLGHSGEVYMLYLAPELMGRGYGSALLRRAFEELSRCRCHWVVVWVLAKNLPARRFYEREELRLDGARRWDAFGDRSVPVVRYARALNPIFDFGELAGRKIGQRR